MHIICIQPKELKILTVKLHYRVKHCKYICTNYSHRFQQNRLIFLLGANRPGAKRLGGRNDQGRNDLGRKAAGAKRLGGELDLGRNDLDSTKTDFRKNHEMNIFSMLCDFIIQTSRF